MKPKYGRLLSLIQLSILAMGVCSMTSVSDFRRQLFSLKDGKHVINKNYIKYIQIQKNSLKNESYYFFNSTDMNTSLCLPRQ